VILFFLGTVTNLTSPEFSQFAEKLILKNSIYSLNLCTGKGKAHPITGHVGPEGGG
jgi:hypothetical protein